MAVSMRDLDPAFKGAGQKAYPAQVKTNELFCLQFIILHVFIQGCSFIWNTCVFSFDFMPVHFPMLLHCYP